MESRQISVLTAQSQIFVFVSFLQEVGWASDEELKIPQVEGGKNMAPKLVFISTAADLR